MGSLRKVKAFMASNGRVSEDQHSVLQQDGEDDGVNA